MPNHIQTPNLCLQKEITFKVLHHIKALQEKQGTFQTLGRDWGGTTGVVQ